MNQILLFCTIDLLITYIIDFSGILDSINKWLHKKANIKYTEVAIMIVPKPFSCSLCLIFWINLFIAVIMLLLNYLTIKALPLIIIITVLNSYLNKRLMLPFQLIKKIFDHFERL